MELFIRNYVCFVLNSWVVLYCVLRIIFLVVWRLLSLGSFGKLVVKVFFLMRVFIMGGVFDLCLWLGKWNDVVFIFVYFLRVFNKGVLFVVFFFLIIL